MAAPCAPPPHTTTLASPGRLPISIGLVVALSRRSASLACEVEAEVEDDADDNRQLRPRQRTAAKAARRRRPEKEAREDMSFRVDHETDMRKAEEDGSRGEGS